MIAVKGETGAVRDVLGWNTEDMMQVRMVNGRYTDRAVEVSSDGHGLPDHQMRGVLAQLETVVIYHIWLCSRRARSPFLHPKCHLRRSRMRKSFRDYLAMLSVLLLNIGCEHQQFLWTT